MSDQEEISSSFGVNSKIANEKRYENGHRIGVESVALVLTLVYLGIDWASKHPDQILYYWNQFTQGQ